MFNVTAGNTGRDYKYRELPPLHNCVIILLDINMEQKWAFYYHIHFYKNKKDGLKDKYTDHFDLIIPAENDTIAHMELVEFLSVVAPKFEHRWTLTNKSTNIWQRFDKVERKHLL